MRRRNLIVVIEVAAAVFVIVSIAKSNQIMRCLRLYMLLPIPKEMHLVELAFIEVVAFDQHLF